MSAFIDGPGMKPGKIEQLTRVGCDPAVISLTRVVLRQNEAVLKMNADLLRSLNNPQYCFELEKE